jgi:hypothetical protein
MWAATTALQLIRDVRTNWINREPIDPTIDPTWTRRATTALAVSLAAMCPMATNPMRALQWTGLPPSAVEQLVHLPVAMRLIRSIRIHGRAGAAAVLDPLTDDETRALVTLLALMTPNTVLHNPRSALAWVDLNPEDWPPDVLAAEAARAKRGATDPTARAAYAQLHPNTPQP